MSTQAVDEFPIEEVGAPEVPASLTTRRSKKADTKSEPETTLAVTQHQQLLFELNQPLDRALVKQREGYGRNKDGSKTMLDYLEWHTVVRELNHLFGYGNWSTDVTSLVDLGTAPENGVPYAVRATVRLTVDFPAQEGEYRGVSTTFQNVGVGISKRRAIYENGRKVGEEPPTWEAYEMAAKTAVHDALKRDAVNLGERYGLGLYAKEEEAKTTSDGGESTTTTTHAAAPRRTTQASSSAAEVAECEECGKEIRGYTNKQGKTYTTQDLVNMSKKASGGQILCYSCRNAQQSARDL